MSDGIAELVKKWNGEAVVSRFDEKTSSWFFVAIHDATLGTPVGGCRMKQYPQPADGLWDAMRLAEGMTYKWAGVNFPFGGGKSVLALSRKVDGEERMGLLRRFGRLLRVLNGAFRTGVDLGTTSADMRVVAEEAPYVMGTLPGESRDPGPFTALGVLEGLRVAVRHAFGDDDLAGRRVLVQGAGGVGKPLARQLAEAGAHILVSDLDGARADELAEELGGEVVPPDLALETECDVFAPCAIGAVLSVKTIPHLRCRVVAGSANNQLETDADADRLYDRGILYAPDYIVNAGGAIAFGLMHQNVHADDELESSVRTIGRTLDEIFAESTGNGESPARVARRRAERVLKAARTEQARTRTVSAH